MPNLLMSPTDGLPEIYKQHKQLIQYLELLELWVLKGYGLAAACAAILFLQDYIASYFRYEEDFLRSHAYPKLEEHIEKHRKIRAQVAQYTQQITDGCDVSSEICLLLREWIMMYTDLSEVSAQNSRYYAPGTHCQYFGAINNFKPRSTPTLS